LPRALRGVPSVPMTAFDELRERLKAIDGRQAAWRHGFVEAYTRLRRERFGRWRRPDAAQEEELAREARKVAGEEHARALFAFLDELCDAYRADPLPQNRAKLRADVGAAQTLLAEVWAYAAQNAELVRGSKDAVRLERALAAVSLDDLRADARDVDELLARLWLAAVRAGLDPRAAFEATAAISNPSTGGGGAFLAQRLRAFEGSLAFKTLVQPELRKRSA
jgi:hypothetical protein